MPTYARRCRQCSLEIDCVHPIQQGCVCKPSACPSCGGPVLRDFRVSIPRASAFRPHYNRSVGAYVHNRREFLDHLKAGSDRLSARLGLDHNFQPIDHPSEVPGVTESGLEETYRQRRKAGLDEPKTKIIT